MTSEQKSRYRYSVHNLFSEEFDESEVVYLLQQGLFSFKPIPLDRSNTQWLFQFVVARWIVGLWRDDRRTCLTSETSNRLRVLETGQL